MAVAFDASSESHTGTAGATSSFTWTHTPSGTPKGVLAFTFTNGSSTDGVIGVAYQGYGMLPVTDGRAVDSSGEPGDCKAWLLSPWSYTPIALAQAATSGVANTFYEVAHGNGYYAACGLSGTIVYKATDPTGSWSTATSGVGTGLWGITYDNGYWVVCGDSGVIRYKSSTPDGSWSGATSGVAGRLQVVRYGNGYWAVCGDGGVIRYKSSTPDGTWSGATSGTGSNLQHIAYGNGYWVAVGGGGTIIYKADTPDGTWSAATSGTASGLYTVHYANGYWVAAGDSGTIRYKASTPDGSWSGADSGTTINFRNGISYADGLWVACGVSGSRCAVDPTGTWSYMFAHGLDPAGVTYGNGYFVHAGAGGLIYYGQRATGPITVPTGAQTVAAATTTSDERYAVAITVTADYGVEATGVVLQQGDQALANTAVNDGSPGTDSVRFAGVFSGLSAVPSANSGSTELQNIDFGNQVVSVIRETTAGQGSRSIGWTAASDDVAAVYLAIREATVPWTVGVPIL